MNERKIIQKKKSKRNVSHIKRQQLNNLSNSQQNTTVKTLRETIWEQLFKVVKILNVQQNLKNYGN